MFIDDFYATVIFEVFSLVFIIGGIFMSPIVIMIGIIFEIATIIIFIQDLWNVLKKHNLIKE